jgi:hypothetical protein
MDLEAAAALLAERSQGDVSGELSDNRIDGELANMGGSGRRAMRALVEQARQCRKRGISLADTIQMARDGKSFRMAIFAPPKLSRHVPVILLDATADPRLAGEVFDRDFDEIDVQVSLNISLTQVHGLTGSKSSLYARNARQTYEEASAAARGAQDRRLGRLADAAVQFANGDRALFVGQKETVEAIGERLPENIETAHFGALRGLNAFEGMGKMIIAGRVLPPRRDLERMRAALYAVRGDQVQGGGKPVTVESWLAMHGLDTEEHIRPDGYCDRGDNPWHPEPITEALRRNACEHEIIQAVGRVRSIWREAPADVLLITDIAVEGLPEPDHILPWAQLVRRGITASPLQRYADACAKKCEAERLPAIPIPLGVEDMADLAPEIFSTKKAAERAREKHGDKPISIRTARQSDWRMWEGQYWSGAARRGAPYVAAVMRTVNDLETAIGDALEFVRGRGVRKLTLKNERNSQSRLH